MNKSPRPAGVSFYSQEVDRRQQDPAGLSGERSEVMPTKAPCEHKVSGPGGGPQPGLETRRDVHIPCVIYSTSTRRFTSAAPPRLCFLSNSVEIGVLVLRVFTVRCKDKVAFCLGENFKNKCHVNVLLLLLSVLSFNSIIQLCIWCTLGIQ